MTFFPYLKTESRTGLIQESLTGGATDIHRAQVTSSSRITERLQIDLIGEQVALGPLEPELLPKYQHWLSGYLQDDFDPIEGIDEFDLDFLDDFTGDFDNMYFTVYETGSWRAVGGAALTEIDYVNEVAEFALIIGESDCRGKGYGTESTRLVLDYAFNALGLHNVMLRVFEYNYSARGAFQRAGFREFSRRRECHMQGARLWDEIFMGCLASEFNSSMGVRIQMPENLNA